ncbi:secreted protein [Melampsora americana]|nr:secreted protein [Melampsora americana]
MPLKIWIPFLILLLNQINVANCAKRILSPRTSNLTLSATRTRMMSDVVEGLPMRISSLDCTPELAARGFKAYHNPEGIDTCVCPPGKGYAKVQGTPYCFACSDEEERIVNGECQCPNGRGTYLSTNLTPEGHCIPPSLQPSALARAASSIHDRRHSRKANAPTSSYRLTPKKPISKHLESCWIKENDHLCLVGQEYECTNHQESISHCGRCNNDCSKIPNADEVSCAQGSCRIETDSDTQPFLVACKAGYTLQKTKVTGHEEYKLECLLN